jgi:hypothetical protein
MKLIALASPTYVIDAANQEQSMISFTASSAGCCFTLPAGLLIHATKTNFKRNARLPPLCGHTFGCESSSTQALRLNVSTNFTLTTSTQNGLEFLIN